ncbi:MtrB/PioB family decaheme-associated outer membrane protein [Halieaceae bacterium]|nr:MtrB/PioB family decaheme-associated outer membrane protein [Halieaceae bacterium]
MILRAAAKAPIAAGLLLAAVATQAQQADPFAPLAAETRPLATRLQTDYRGVLELGLGYTSDDNFMFGQYNGLQDKGANLIGNLSWDSFRTGDSYWRGTIKDLGLETREGELTWGLHDRLRLTAGFDQQLQVRNDSGRTPFSGSNALQLPQNWVSGLYTSDWTELDQNLQRFDRELERNNYYLDVSGRLNANWQVETSLRYEDRNGTAERGAAIYADAASGDAVLLPTNIDYRTTEFEAGLIFDGSKLHLDGRLEYSDFDNREQSLSWQNPYSSFGPNVRYPSGEGALALAPDNSLLRGRLTGLYVFSPIARLQFDGSYGVTEQDQGFLDYSVNPALRVDEPLPRSNLDAELATSTFNTRLLLRPLPKLDVEARFKIHDRDYDMPRDGYRYIRGDGTNQPREALTAYNTSHDYLAQTAGFEVAYRLPLRSRIEFDYDYEWIRRRNAAVEQTDESRYTVAYRIRPLAQLGARFELLYGDRAAETYQWDQSYYALLDPQLINATPESQRYITHPDLSQYYLANRERTEAKIDLDYTPAAQWTLALNLLWRDDDFDKSELGVRDSEWQRLHLSASYAPAATLSASVFGGLDRYESSQANRAFRGGQEKNAFAIYPPLPQASDPSRNWGVDTTDDSLTLGASLAWQATEELSFELDYNYVDTTAEQALSAAGAADLAPEDFPDVKTRLHQLGAKGRWQLREALSVGLEYQYYRYSSDDWAWAGVAADTMGKVLSFGEQNPNEQIHYVGASVMYHWQ